MADLPLQHAGGYVLMLLILLTEGNWQLSGIALKATASLTIAILIPVFVFGYARLHLKALEDPARSRSIYSAAASIAALEILLFLLGSFLVEIIDLPLSLNSVLLIVVITTFFAAGQTGDPCQGSANDQSESNPTNQASNLVGPEPRRVVLNWVRQMCRSALLFLLLVLPVTAEPVESGYATEKIASPARTDRASVRLALPASELPDRGVLIATGNLLSPLARWIVLNFDRLTIRQATTRLAGGGRMVQIESERIDTLSGDERRAVISAANEVWSNPDRNPPMLDEPTDGLCSIALFDSDDVLHEFGSVCPRPRLVAALEMVVASVDRHTSSSDQTTALSSK